MNRYAQPKRPQSRLVRDGNNINEIMGLGTFVKYKIVAEVKGAFLCVRLSSDDYDPVNKCRPIVYVSQGDIAEK